MAITSNTDRLYDTDLTDAAWELIAPMLPVPRPGGRPRTTNIRAVLNAIFYLLRTGCQWRLLPREFPAWSTVYHYFRDWKNAGVWACLQRSARSQAGRAALAPHGPKRRYWRVAPEQKVSTTRNSPTASNDLQSATTHTDYRPNRTTQPAPPGMAELLRQVALWSGYAADQLATRKPAETAPSAAKSATLANPRRKHTVSAT